MKGSQKKHDLRFSIVILVAACAYSGVNAMEKSYRPIEIRFGPFDVLPMLEVAESYNDNIFFNDIARKSSMVTQIRSGFQLALDRKLNRYAFNYAFQSQQYHASPRDDYVDQYLGGQTHVEFTRRHRMDFDASFVDGHYQRGTNFSQGVAGVQSIKQPDTFQQVFAQTRYRYGGERAKGNLEMVVGVNDLTFTNNRQRTRAWDRTDLTVIPGFYYRIFPNTYSLVQMENVFVDYKNNNVRGFANPDYTKQRYLLGAAWKPLAKTEGSIRLGYLRQVFDVPRLQGVSGFTWDVNVLWEPKTYSRFSFSINRDIGPTLGFGISRLIESYGSSWVHDWNSRVSTQVAAAYQNVDNRGSGRHDDILSFRLGANYSLGRWLGIGINYTYLNQQSTFNALDFGQNVIMFYVAGNPTMSRASPTPWQHWY